jgi:hypothetical protein
MIMGKLELGERGDADKQILILKQIGKTPKPMERAESLRTFGRRAGMMMITPTISQAS